jgi:hypothetical protein
MHTTTNKNNNTLMSKFYWNEETIQHFRFQSNYINEKQMLESVKDFVACDCTLEDGETEEDLVIDLMEQIYK